VLAISSAFSTRAAIGVIANEGGSCSNGSRKNEPPLGAVLGLNMTAARVMPGATCFSISSHFPIIDGAKFVKSVVLPPGRAMLSTKRLPTGSETPTNTIGMISHPVAEQYRHQAFRKSSGSFATLTAIRRAASRLGRK
jgi:hypothetical protein